MATIHVTGDVLQEAARLQMNRILSLTTGNLTGADCFHQAILRLAEELGIDPEELEKRATDCVAIQLSS